MIMLEVMVAVLMILITLVLNISVTHVDSNITDQCIINFLKLMTRAAVFRCVDHNIRILVCLIESSGLLLQNHQPTPFHMTPKYCI